VVIAMMLVASEIAIFCVYLSLCYENHHWWWAAFRIPASVSLAFFGYCLFFMAQNYRPPDAASACIYLTFSGLIALGLALANGSVGFLASFLFVRRIFGAVKLE
jgi:transmembrane 9 superfamily protein 2/4